MQTKRSSDHEKLVAEKKGSPFRETRTKMALSGPAPREVGFAYGYGYIQAALQAIETS